MSVRRHDVSILIRWPWAMARRGIALERSDNIPQPGAKKRGEWYGLALVSTFGRVEFLWIGWRDQLRGATTPETMPRGSHENEGLHPYGVLDAADMQRAGSVRRARC
jgi:hypothetical protein